MVSFKLFFLNIIASIQAISSCNFPELHYNSNILIKTKLVNQI